MYRIADSDIDQMIATIMLENVFGIHNLTSDAEEEADEVLTVSRKKVQELHKEYCAELDKEEKYSASWYVLNGRNHTLEYLFGSKCLPDEEPKPAEPELRSDGTAIFDNIITDNFRDHNSLRSLQIAAMALRGALSNPNISSFFENDMEYFCNMDLEYADTLIEAASKNKDK